MLRRRRRWDWLAITAIAAAMVGLPPTALAADHGNPEVIGIEPSTGTQTVLASGSPWTQLAGIAVGPSGTIYVSNFGRPDGSGIFALTPPGFAISPFATTATMPSPQGDVVALAGSTLYILASGVRSVDTSAPFTQRIVSPGCDTETTDCIPDPDYAAISGSTLYGTTYVDCYANGYAGNLALGNWVSAIDIATGTRKQIAFHDCHAPALQGIAAAADGTLLVAASGHPSVIDRVNPLDGKMTVVSKGGALHDPRGIALTPSGDLVVADASGAVLRISTQTGKQATIASGPDFTGATGVAVDATGKIYVTTDGPPPVLKVSAAPRQHFSSAGIRVRASCRPRCIVGYSYTLNGGPSSGERDVLTGVGATRTIRIKLEASSNRQIRNALRRGRKVRVRLTLAAQTVSSAGPGTTVTVRLTN